ncbi:MAG: glycosyltransferase family 2 protein [Candidatus Moraniibacteriota bacterium]
MSAISLIFVNYRSARYLESALQSLFAQEKEEDFEIIISNNDAEETVTLHGLQARYPFTLVENRGNIGFAAACNRAAAQASGEVIGFLNPDILWREKLLPSIIAIVQNEQAVIGLSLLTTQGLQQAYDHGHAPTLSRLFLNHLLPRSLWRHASTNLSLRSVDWVSGCTLFLPQALFSQLGGFDEDFFLYYEDIDLCMRAKLAGRPVWYASGFAVTHLGGKSQPSRASQKRAYFASQRRYFGKHRPLWERLLLPLFQKATRVFS